MTHQVVLRDDDMNATTPLEVWKALMAPFLDRNQALSVSLIPEVDTSVRLANGKREGYLFGEESGIRPLEKQSNLTRFIRDHQLITILQHGCEHAFVNGHFEFRHHDHAELRSRLRRGRNRLLDCGLSPSGFAAPQDEMSQDALSIVGESYELISARAYGYQKMPRKLLAEYLWQKRICRQDHFHLNGRRYLTHRGCLLDPNGTSPSERVARALQTIRSQKLSVVVMHHWQHLARGEQNALEELSAELAKSSDIDVIPIDKALI